ncbi:MAG: tyrosine-type recombinase/integrase, partial [Pyrinomonadaceae bacterium]
MTALSLRAVVAEALADVGVRANFTRIPKGRPRTTTWLGIEHGFGIRHYATGRGVYIVQTRMAGRLRTVTLGSVAVLTRYQATMVARRVIAYAQVGRDPATDRQRIRSSPRFDDFLVEYWEKWAPRWKRSTYEVQTSYRALYLDRAFPGIFIDGLNEADVTKWFADLNNRTGPGAANRALDILKGMLNKAESWGYRLENTNPCRVIRRNPGRKCERFLSDPELARLGGILAEARASDDEMRRVVATAITLLLLTGARRGEILGLQWRDVRGNRLKLRDSKTGAKTVWLGDEARHLIDTLPRDRVNPWLFWNRRYDRPIRTVDQHWTEIRDKAGLSNLRLHDLRHTF